MSRVEEDPYEEEERHYKDVRSAFVYYGVHTQPDVEKMERNVLKLPPEVSALLPDGLLNKKVAGLKEAIKRNQAFLDRVIGVQDQVSPFPLEDAAGAGRGSSSTSFRQISKVRSTLHQMVRDWSVEGEEERKQCYGPLLEELEKMLPVDHNNRNKLQVLVPGSGLGRLPLEIASRGYATQGNEFSYHMLFVSNFMLNYVEQVDSIALSPFIDTQCNNFSAEDMLRTIRVPDVSPTSLIQAAARAPSSSRPQPRGQASFSAEDPGGRGAGAAEVCLPDFSMAAGEWLAVYADQSETWEAVVTCFFIDTAPVITEYVEAIARLLKPGGVWINLGPLLYHWANGSTSGEVDERFERSVELTWEEIKVVVANCGLELVREETRECSYNRNQRSMMHTVYTCVLSTAVKRMTSPS